MGSHFHQGGVIYALGRNDWGSHFPGGVIRDFDTVSMLTIFTIAASLDCRLLSSSVYRHYVSTLLSSVIVLSPCMQSKNTCKQSSLVSPVAASLDWDSCTGIQCGSGEYL